MVSTTDRTGLASPGVVGGEVGAVAAEEVPVTYPSGG